MLKRIKKLGEENEYEDIPFIPPTAKPVTGPQRVGDLVEIAPNGYIKRRYRIDSQPKKTGGLGINLFER